MTQAYPDFRYAVFLLRGETSASSAASARRLSCMLGVRVICDLDVMTCMVRTVFVSDGAVDRRYGKPSPSKGFSRDDPALGRGEPRPVGDASVNEKEGGARRRLTEAGLCVSVR